MTNRLVLARPRARAGKGGPTRTRLRSILLAGALVLGLASTGATSASADSTLPVTGISVDQNHGVVRPTIQISRLYPGAQQQAVLLLDGSRPELARRMEIGVTSLADLENECIHPETGSGDTTCGDDPGQGELSQFLDLTLRAGVEGASNGHRTCQPIGTPISTTLNALAQKPELVGLTGDDGTLCVIATFAHRNTPGDNVTQTDLVRFDLRLRFDTLTVPTPTGSPTSTSTPSSTPSSPSTTPTQTATPTESATATTTGSPTSGGDEPTVGGGSGDDGDDGTQVEGVKYERPVVVSRVESGRAELGALPRTGTNLPNLLIIAATLLGVGTVMVAVVRGRRRPRKEA